MTFIINSALRQRAHPSKKPSLKNKRSGWKKACLATLGFTVIKAEIVASSRFSEAASHVMTPRDLCSLNTDESRRICDGNLGMERRSMPQLDSQDTINRFIEFYTSQGGVVVRGDLDPNDLTPIQKEINENIVRGMVESAKAGKRQPCDSTILVGVDAGTTTKYILDGHHRYAACTILGGTIRTISFNGMAIHTVLEYMNSFDGVDHYGL